MKYKEFRSQKCFDGLEASDTDWVFCEVLNKKRTELVENIELTKKQQNILKNYAKKLRKGVPLAQVIGYTEFLGNKISVNKHVLAPRAETEELAFLSKKEILQKPNAKVLDLCTGSGAIAISVADVASVTASDISKKALAVARKNAKKNSRKVTFICSNMFNKIYGLFDFIISNPPYIAWGDSRVDKNVQKYEPAIALYAGKTGLEYYKKIANSAKYYLLPNGKIYLEVGEGQAQDVAALFNGYSAAIIKKDMQGVERFVIITK